MEKLWPECEGRSPKRSLLGRMLFRANGRPTRLLRRVLFHENGKPRGLFRSLVVDKDGMPYKYLRQWMSSVEYLVLPKAHFSYVQCARIGTERPVFTPWRNALDAPEIDDAELDSLVERIRAEVRASRVPSSG